MAITKTDFMRGMQCRRMLWLDKHKPVLTGIEFLREEERISKQKTKQLLEEYVPDTFEVGT